MTTKAHGGARPGAGRKPTGDGRTERLSVRLKPKLAARLRESGRAGELVEEAFDFWDANQDRPPRLESGDVIQANPTPKAGNPSPASLEIGDGNQDGLTLSFLAGFAALGRKVWRDGGDGICPEDIPLGLDDAAFHADWGHWVEEWKPGSGAELLEAYRAYGPMAERVREALLRANPLLDAEELASVLRSGTDTVDSAAAIKLLHDYALIINDHGQPCDAKSLLAFMRAADSRTAADDTGWWIMEALEAGRMDVAVAFGAGDYANHGEEAVLIALRAKVKLSTALEWWGRDPEFCRKVDPIIETLAGTPGFPALAQKADKVRFWGMIRGIEPDWASLADFKAAWAPMAAKHGDETLFALFERFTAWTRAQLRHRLALRVPGEPDPGPDLAILGLQPGATRKDIKAAWRRFVQRHHPDKGGDHEHFIHVKAAYDRLGGGGE